MAQARKIGAVAVFLEPDDPVKVLTKNRVDNSPAVMVSCLHDETRRSRNSNG